MILPAAVLSEVEGTYRNAVGRVMAFPAITPVPGSARPEWAIIRELAKAMGLEGFGYGSVGEITGRIAQDMPPAPFSGLPRRKVADIPTRYRRHLLADFVCALESLGIPTSPVEPLPEGLEGGYPVLERREVIPNFHMAKIQAPQVARYARPRLTGLSTCIRQAYSRIVT